MLIPAHAELQLFGRGSDGQGPGWIRRGGRVRRRWELVCSNAAEKVCFSQIRTRTCADDSGVGKLLLIDVS